MTSPTTFAHASIHPSNLAVYKIIQSASMVSIMTGAIASLWTRLHSLIIPVSAKMVKLTSNTTLQMRIEVSAAMEQKWRRMFVYAI